MPFDANSWSDWIGGSMTRCSGSEDASWSEVWTEFEIWLAFGVWTEPATSRLQVEIVVAVVQPVVRNVFFALLGADPRLWQHSRVSTMPPHTTS